MYVHVISVVLITGGVGSGTNTAEIYDPSTKTSCSLPKLPDLRFRHSQVGGMLCGGGPVALQKTCVWWTPDSGTWTQSPHTLRHERQGHMSWDKSSLVYLIGGSLRIDPPSREPPYTSEKLKVDGSVEEGFGLKYDTRLLTYYKIIRSVSLV